MPKQQPDPLSYIASWFENAGSITSSGKINENAFLIANPSRTEQLNFVHKHLGGTIEDFTTKNNKTYKGLYFTKEEWKTNLTKLMPYFISERRKYQAQRLINSLI